ncbi:MAG TPA: tetratricopeptide repeat protein [Ktedonobacterales bacterium]|nr:tetratricopeptide repeat protein [Ktedonobacterales bacterium]
MLSLFVRILMLPLRFRSGRGLSALILLGVSLLLLFHHSDAEAANTIIIVAGVVALLIGLVLLYFFAWMEILPRNRKHVRQAFVDWIKRLFGRGRALPIPSLPSTPPRGASASTLKTVERYALKMAGLPWGEHPDFASVEEAYPRFNQTVGRVRTMTGDRRALSEHIYIFIGLPKPLCYIGAAEVMHSLSYLGGDLWVPVGLQQGLRFIAWAQYHDPFQPDALIARAKLLTSYKDDRWLELALETLEIVRQVAPQHLRLPDAEASLLIRGRQYEAALARLEATLAHPPTPEEIHVALTRKARLLDRMQRYDEALAIYDLINARYPQDPWTWHNKSLLLMSLRRYSEALACNERALSIMDFNAARLAGARIRAQMAEAQRSYL